MNAKKKIEIIGQLKQLQKSKDTEMAHVKADEILMYLLIELGHENIVKEYDKIDKWYA